MEDHGRRNPLAVFAIAASTIMVACVATPSKFEELADQPTPSSWVSPSRWQFTITGKDRPSGTLTLSLGEEVVQTCVGGSWKRATMIATSISNPPLHHWYRPTSEGGAGLFPAYQIKGRNLQVVLNAPVCDNDWVLRGVLTEAGATGQFATEGMFGGEVLGTFAAEPSTDAG